MDTHTSHMDFFMFGKRLLMSTNFSWFLPPTLVIYMRCSKLTYTAQQPGLLFEKFPCLGRTGMEEKEGQNIYVQIISKTMQEQDNLLFFFFFLHKLSSRGLEMP